MNTHKMIAGYESQQAFTSIFKSMYKQTPFEYRQNQAHGGVPRKQEDGGHEGSYLRPELEYRISPALRLSHHGYDDLHGTVYYSGHHFCGPVCEHVRSLRYQYSMSHDQFLIIVVLPNSHLPRFSYTLSRP